MNPRFPKHGINIKIQPIQNPQSQQKAKTHNTLEYTTVGYQPCTIKYTNFDKRYSTWVSILTSCTTMVHVLL